MWGSARGTPCPEINHPQLRRHLKPSTETPQNATGIHSAILLIETENRCRIGVRVATWPRTSDLTCDASFGNRASKGFSLCSPRGPAARDPSSVPGRLFCDPRKLHRPAPRHSNTVPSYTLDFGRIEDVNKEIGFMTRCHIGDTT